MPDGQDTRRYSIREDDGTLVSVGFKTWTVERVSERVDRLAWGERVTLTIEHDNDPEG
jgi:hypothetical protein